jgi:TRAP-type C4-dicarboxylate transport system permease small subunit
MSDAGDGPEDVEHVQPNAGAVEAIHDQLVGWLGEDRARADATNQRASWLLGFCGVVLGLAASQADEVFKNSSRLGSFGRVFASSTLALAFVSVAIAAFFSLRALILARSSAKEIAIDDAEVADVLADENLLATKAWNQLRNAQVVQKQIPTQRRRNKASASALWKAFAALLIGVALLVAYAGVFIENAIEAGSCSTAVVRQVAGAERRNPAFADTSLFVDASQASPAASGVPVRQVVIKPPCPDTTTVP